MEDMLQKQLSGQLNSYRGRTGRGEMHPNNVRIDIVWVCHADDYVTQQAPFRHLMAGSASNDILGTCRRLSTAAPRQLQRADQSLSCLDGELSVYCGSGSGSGAGRGSSSGGANTNAATPNAPR
jgi:hypothetical protein